MTARFMIFRAVHEQPSPAIIGGLMRHRAPAWAVVVRYPGPRDQWHLWAGRHSDDRAEAQRNWHAVLRLVELAKEVGERISAVLIGPPRSVAPAEATLERGVQLLIAPNLAVACQTCGAPMPPNAGRPGRPRAHCTTCRPPTWPRRGEHWLFEGSPVVVLGSTKRHRPRVRVRPLDSGHAREIPGEYWARGAVRVPHSTLEAS